jgi:hypothetical protein
MVLTRGPSISDYLPLNKSQRWSKGAWLVLHHDDFDGLLSSCFFNLRGIPAIDASPSRTFYHAIQHGRPLDLSKLAKAIQKVVPKAESIKVIMLDYAINPDSSKWLLDFDKVYPSMSLYMAIDHHVWPKQEQVLPTIAICNEQYLSCTKLIADTFCVPYLDENLDAVANTIKAAEVIDCGGSKFNEATLIDVVTTIPGCLTFYNAFGKLNTDTARRIVCEYLTGTLTRESKAILKRFIDFTQRALNTRVTPVFGATVNGKSCQHYLFSQTRLDTIQYFVSILTWHHRYEDDYSFFYVEDGDKDIDGMTTYRVSMRTKNPKFPIADFCLKEFSGGGRETGAGGFKIKSSDLALTMAEVQAKLTRWLEKR